MKRTDNGSDIPLSGFSETLNRRTEVMQLIQKLETEKKQIEQEVKLYLGDAERAEGEGYRITWIENIFQNRSACAVLN